MAYSIDTGRLTRRKLLGGLAATAYVAGCGNVGAQNDERAESRRTSQAIAINARAIAHFQPGRPDTRRFGDLEFRGGLVLSSPAQDFGGWSGLVMAVDGGSILLVSDRGFWLRANVDYAGNRPAAIADACIGSLRALRGRALRKKRERDAESIALVDGSLERAALLIGFERVHRIGRFDILGGQMEPPSRYLRLPAEASRMAGNQGIEALAVIRAGALRGSVVAFAERLTRGSGYHTGWLWTRGTRHRLHLQDLGGFNITGAAGLPDGGLLVLERDFRWTTGLRMRIRRLQPAEIRPGARLTGHTVLQADLRHQIDNMEGIAVHGGRHGETVVSLISDDNYNRLLQRTVFLQFTLPEE